MLLGRGQREKGSAIPPPFRIPARREFRTVCEQHPIKRMCLPPEKKQHTLSTFLAGPESFNHHIETYQFLGLIPERLFEPLDALLEVFDVFPFRPQVSFQAHYHCLLSVD